MTKEVLEIAAIIVTSLGGGGAIVFALSNWLGKVWANRLMAREVAKHSGDLEALRSELVRSTESYKIKLKKSELIFQKEIEAASELVFAIREFLPTFRHPDMDWGDACDEIALDFEKIEKRLNVFLARNGVVIPDLVKDKIGKCIGIAGEGKFQINGMEVSTEGNRMASELYDELWAAEKAILVHVRSQTSI
jgi:hypothetical protein